MDPKQKSDDYFEFEIEIKDLGSDAAELFEWDSTHTKELEALETVSYTLSVSCLTNSLQNIKIGSIHRPTVPPQSTFP
jgi:hypothetical protein